LNSTETPEPLPAIPVVGGADKIAFLKDNDIWLVNLDGSDLIQLTDDGGSKTELQWTPDGSGIVYISGLCIQRVTIENRRIDNLACFEYLASLDEFEISPDGNQIAISINQQLYIVPMDLEQLSQVGYWSDIQAMAECKEMAPWASNTGAPYAVRQVIWSKDMQTIAVVVLGVEADRQVEMGRVLDVSQCIASPRRLDEFPASRFTITTYNDNPLIRPLGWDGVFNFVMTGYTRNGGFGDLYFYNYDLHRAQIKINPIDGACCYRDPSFSPDGSYVIFAFQDIRQGAQGQIQIYYIPYGTLGTGLKYQPLPLPADFFTNPKESPQPILHPAS
jgi:dipeptidyl aminopeptidase/acylaminoacyl peptidase